MAQLTPSSRADLYAADESRAEVARVLDVIGLDLPADVEHALRVVLLAALRRTYLVASEGEAAARAALEDERALRRRYGEALREAGVTLPRLGD